MFIFENLSLLETAYGQIWPLHFIGPGNPGVKERERERKKRTRECE